MADKVKDRTPIEGDRLKEPKTGQVWVVSERSGWAKLSRMAKPGRESTHVYLLTVQSGTPGNSEGVLVELVEIAEWVFV